MTLYIVYAGTPTVSKCILFFNIGPILSFRNKLDQ